MSLEACFDRIVLIDRIHTHGLSSQKPLMYYQELMSHPKGGKGAVNYVVTALSKVLAVL